jgi:hypothetical protein
MLDRAKLVPSARAKALAAAPADSASLVTRLGWKADLVHVVDPGPAQPVVDVGAMKVGAKRQRRALVRRLEQQLRVALQDRSSRQVRFSVAGEQLLERGRALLAHADIVVGDVQAVERSASAVVRRGASPAARFGLVPELLQRWSSVVAPGG